MVVGGGGGGEVVGGDVGGGLVGAGLVGIGFDGAGMVGPGLLGFAGAGLGDVVVEEDGLDPDGDAGGTVAIGAELVVLERLIFPFALTVNQLFAKPCPPACV